jgi:F-type H+-transporting ATPase subunit b
MGAIGVSWQVLVAQLVNFGIVIALLMVFLPKIRKKLEARTERIKESMKQADQIKEQLARSEEQVKAQLDAARKEGQVILAQATQLGEKLKEEARAEAKKQAESIVVKARADIEMERDKAIGEVRRQFVDLTVLAAEKVVKESLDKEKHRRLIEEVLNQASKGNG